jgi:hypothetical protein
MRARGPLLAVIGCVASIASTGCASREPRRFPLKDPVWVDDDLRPVSVPCREVKGDDGKLEEICRPEEYVSPFAWDVADKTLFRPMSQFFAMDFGFEAKNVNALDEVPDSSWFTNRIGVRPFTVDDLRQGSCPKLNLDPAKDADGSWVIDQGKPNGANPGFRVKVEGVGRFMLKADPDDQPERATGATAIASRLYYAAGWWAPCDSVVYVEPRLLTLKPGLKVTDNTGTTKPFDQEALEALLLRASKRGERTRFGASKWLPGRPLGPFTYAGTRDDDPNDVIPHEDRRDLRGARVMAAWLNHFDSREQNSMRTWMAVNEKAPESSPGHVRHWYLDLGDCFGSEWAWDGISRRLGHAYYLDLPYLFADFFTLGIIERPWDVATRSPDGAIFGYFRSEDFEPHAWRGGYPNPTFDRMTELDGAWATRIIARFTREHLEAVVRVGDYSNKFHSEVLTKALIRRRDKIRERYFKDLSPVADVRVTGSKVCATDLARQAGTWPDADFKYEATLHTGKMLDQSAKLTAEKGASGAVCVELPKVAASDSLPESDPGRYAVLDVTNGVAEGPLRVHFYDLGSKGFKLVGLERPTDSAPTW